MKVNFIECEWIDNPRIKIAKCVDAKAQHEKMRRNTTKTNHRHKLQYTKFSVIDFVLTNKGNFLDTGPKIGLWQIFHLSFSFSASRMPLLKPPNT